MTSAEEVPDRVLARAREIYDAADEFNAYTWHGPLQDGMLDAVAYVWRKAHEAGYQQGCEDSA